MATFIAGQPYTGKVIDPSQGGAVVDYKPSVGDTSQALQQQQSGVQLTSSPITPAGLSTKSPYVPATTQQTPIPDLSYLAPPPQVNPTDNPANQPSQLTPTESRIKSQIDELMGVNQGLEGKAKDTALYNEQFGVNAASDAITGLNSQLTGLINESKAIPLAIQQNAQVGGANVTKGGLAPIQTAQLRNNAIQSLAVSSQIDALNGQLANAIKKVDRAIAYKYADLEARSATLTKNLEILKNDPSLTLEQQDRVDKKLAAQKAYDEKLAKQKKNETDTHDAILRTLSNNSGNPKLTSQVVAALQAAKTPEEVLALENYFGLSSISKSDQLDQTYKQAQIDKLNYDLAHPQKHTQVIEAAGGHTQLINTDTGDVIKDYGVKAAPSGTSAPVQNYNGEFEATIKLAAQQGSTNEQRGQIEQNLKQFIAAGDYKSAYAQVANATLQGLKGSTATTFANQQNSLGVLSALKTAIQQYADAGGNTNIFKGGVDDIQTKIGQLYTDPKYAALATQLDSAFQQYRLNMTGAAFGAKESAEYASVLPSKGNSLDLNLAKLKGAEDYLNSSVNTSIKNVVGDGGVNIKDRAMMGDSGTQQTQTSDTGLNDDQAYQLYLQMTSKK